MSSRPATLDAPLARWGATDFPSAGLILELGKGRLSALVLITTLVGYLLAGPVPSWLHLIATLLGTGLAALGANAFNQVIEVRRDARMPRTAERPVVTGRMTRSGAFRTALVLSLAGPAILLLLVNPLAAAVAVATQLTYVFVYTPLKVRSVWNTAFGAVVGALPPLIGWFAVRPDFTVGALSLALLLFIWQIPHFLSLAWLYRDDYRAGGFRMLSVHDAHARKTRLLIVLSSVALAIAAGWFGVVELTGPIGRFFGTMLSLAVLALAVIFAITPSEVSARRLFLATVLYLPLVLIVWVIDRRPPIEAPTVPASLVSVVLSGGTQS